MSDHVSGLGEKPQGVLEMGVDRGRIFIGKLPSRGDLLESLTSVCREENIQFGVLSVIGAVSAARLGYYKQDEQQYMECVNLDRGLEITSCIGNISLMDGEIFVHAHATLSDDQGRCYGGHLVLGTIIFAAEYSIQELAGETFRRENDAETGLMLWAGK